MENCEKITGEFCEKLQDLESLSKKEHLLEELCYTLKRNLENEQEKKRELAISRSRVAIEELMHFLSIGTPNPNEDTLMEIVEYLGGPLDKTIEKSLEFSVDFGGCTMLIEDLAHLKVFDIFKAPMLEIDIPSSEVKTDDWGKMMDKIHSFIEDLYEEDPGILSQFETAVVKLTQQIMKELGKFFVEYHLKKSKDIQNMMLEYGVK